MADPVSEIVERFFARARADPAAAALADGFAAAHREGQWTAERLDRIVQAYIEDNDPGTNLASRGEPPP
jgi:hypothetical protein